MAESNFVDYVKIYCRSGKGGRGSTHFRREKYIPKGGPDGGDGGRGGHIYIRANRNYWTLLHLRYDRHIIATPGMGGSGKRSTGADGEDRVIEVPVGTVVYDAETGEFIMDMKEDGQEAILLRGGRGGKGNTHFKTSTNQAPRYAQPGEPAEERTIILQLKMLADVGLVGLPNAGKSTLLSVLTAAKPKIANYHFTTLDPHLGVVDVKGAGGFVMADIPGLIEGASEGVGLGHDFLRHIERTKVLVHVVDAASTEGRDPVEDIKTIMNELKGYDESLLDRPQVIAANKIDAIYDEENDNIKRIREAFPDIKVFPISGVSGKGIPELLYELINILSTIDRTPTVFEKEFEIDYSSDKNLPFTVEIDEDGVFVVEGPRIEKMLGYTNLDSEKGFDFFQKFLKTSGVLEKLEEAGIEDGNTVRMYGHEFDYYK